MRAHFKLSLLIRIRTIDNIRLFLRNLESLDDCFARFESIVSSLRSCSPLAYSDNERAKQLLYVLVDHVWGMKITALEEFADFATLDTEKLFSKLNSHELSRKGHPNHDTFLTSKASIISACVGGHDANPTNPTVSSALEFALSSLAAASDEQYENIPDDDIALLARKFYALHNTARRGGGHLGDALSAATPPTSSLTAPRGRSSTPPTSTSTRTEMIPSTRVMARISTASGTTRRRSSRRSCLECVLP
jgi:hypothetical protein